MIKILGATRDRLTITEQDIRTCQREIGSVRRNIRRMADWKVSRDEAIEIETDVREIRVHTEMARQATRIKLNRPGRRQ